MSNSSLPCLAIAFSSFSKFGRQMRYGIKSPGCFKRVFLTLKSLPCPTSEICFELEERQISIVNNSNTKVKISDWEDLFIVHIVEVYSAFNTPWCTVCCFWQ